MWKRDIEELLHDYESLMDLITVAREEEMRQELEAMEICKLGALYAFAFEKFYAHTLFAPVEFHDTCNQICDACET